MGICKNNKLIKLCLGNKQIDGIFKNGTCILKNNMNSLTNLILKNNILKVEPPDFSKISPSEESDDSGLYSMIDNDGTSYYFRGAINNNYVKFGVNKDGNDMYWRIIRINGNGSIRMIYDGTQAYDNTNQVNERIALHSQFNIQGSSEYTGYTYKPYINGVLSSEEHMSAIKTNLESWYEENIKDTEFEKKLSDEPFFNDRSKVSGTNYSGTFDNLINRKKPRLQTTYESYLYTSKTSGKGNKKLEYPIGLITADEIALAGGVYGQRNSQYYLFKGTSYWSISPANYDNSSSTMFVIVGSSGSLRDYGVTSNLGVAPVINLKKDTKVTGIGTKDDPYVVI